LLALSNQHSAFSQNQFAAQKSKGLSHELHESTRNKKAKFKEMPFSLPVFFFAQKPAARNLQLE
jgi:hypothetical protein